jgi:hypothetical protein
LHRMRPVFARGLPPAEASAEGRGTNFDSSALARRCGLAALQGMIVNVTGIHDVRPIRPRRLPHGECSKGRAAYGNVRRSAPRTSGGAACMDAIVAPAGAGKTSHRKRTGEGERQKRRLEETFDRSVHLMRQGRVS